MNVCRSRSCALSVLKPFLKDEAGDGELRGTGWTRFSGDYSHLNVERDVAPDPSRSACGSLPSWPENTIRLCSTDALHTHCGQTPNLVHSPNLVFFRSWFGPPGLLRSATRARHQLLMTSTVS